MTLRRKQRGAALLAFFAVLVTVLTLAGVATLQRMATRAPAQVDEREVLVAAANALRAHVLIQHCRNPGTLTTDLLPCPDTGAAEGDAAATCPGVTRGWLPWRTLGLPPARDASGTCLWYERQGAIGRVIAPQAARAGQNRTSLASRLGGGGNLAAANYLDATDPSVPVVVNLAPVSATCP